MPKRSRPARLGTLLAVAALALITASLAGAGFTSPASAGPISIATATLQPPTGATATQTNCRNNKPVQITVNWTATTSAFATGYTIQRSTTSGGPYNTIGTLPSGTTTYTDTDPTLAYTTTYDYIVQATYQAWTATSNQASLTTLNNLCH
jgi:cellulose 1,4-beta-cellobiosidase